MHFALADSLGRAVDALDSGSASSSTLASGPRVGLENRRGILLAALAPLSAERIRVVLASFAGMAARAQYDPRIARALADQAVQDLSRVPGFALPEAADAFRQGKVGDGRWRPTPGELAKEARKRAEPFFAELQRIDRVLDSPLLQREPEKRISPEQRAQLSAMLRGVGSGLGAP
jgi:hypothetical protein